MLGMGTGASLENDTMRIIQLILIGSLLLATTVAADDFPETTVDGMQRIPDTTMDAIYALPDATLTPYTRVYIAPVQVSFVAGYKRKINSLYVYHVTDEDMENMKRELAAEFTEVFTEVLQNEGGYVVVDGAADDVLAIRAAIIDLDVNAPEAGANPNTRGAIPSVGQMTLYMELIDSVSGDILAKAIDHQWDRTRVRINVRNKDRNAEAARAILRDWASQLRDGLDEAHTRTAK